MKLGQQMDLLQIQKLIMTPQLQQAISILQLNSLELKDFIEEQLLENPLLEIVAENQEAGDQKDEQEPEFDTDWQDYFANKSDLGYQNEVRQRDPFENYYIRSASLEDYLNEQVRGIDLDDEKLALVKFLIGNLDDNGYLSFSTKEIAEQLGIKKKQIKNALEIIQSLDPAGVGAGNIEECLLLQLKRKGLSTPALRELILNHLEDIAEGRFHKIAQALALEVAEVQEMVDLLKGLNPKPGAPFASGQEIKYIVPDIILKKFNDEYLVLVNDSLVPGLMINDLYKGIINCQDVDQLTKSFINENFHRALWIIKSIEQRRLTLYKIVNALVKMQRDFLDRGEKYLNPLVLKEIALEIGMHESTVSRAIANKYIQTPKGVFALKDFFSSGLRTKTGEQVSALHVKKKIEELIKVEDNQTPFSDQRLAALLLEKGIKIARRTIAKYREELGIPAAKLRKRY